MGKDTTAFKQRFNDYKNGKPVSEIYDAGLPRYGGGKPAYQTFIEDMGPVLFQEMVAQGVKNPEAAYKNMITQLAYESNYGQSRVAREQNNFGGVGWNGKTYTTYKDKADFVRNYVRLMNSRYKNVITADTLYDYAKGLKGLNYYEDSVENYTRNLTGMKSFAKALDAHMANNPDLYVLQQADAKPMSQTTAAELNAISQFQPWQNYHQPDYPLNNPAPSSISSWNNPKSPAYTPAGLQTRRIDFGKMMMDMLEDDWEPPAIQPLKTVVPPDSKISTFTGFKNGKLPGYKIGHNVSNAKLNEDGTFTDDYTKVFEDTYVTPQKTDLKRSSYTLNNFPYYLQHRTDWTKPFMSSGTNEKGLEQPAIDPFLIASTGGRISGDLIGDAIGLGAEKAVLHAATTAARSAAKTKMGKRAVETVMRTSSNPTPFDKIKNGIKTFDKNRTKAVLNYIFTGKRNGSFGYYNSFAEDPSLAYTGFVSDKLKKTADDLDEANIMLHNPESEYGDAIDVYLYNKQIDPVYGFDLKSIGYDFGPHDQYIAQNYKKVSKNIPIYQSPVQTLEIKIPDQQAYKVKPIETIGDEGYIRGNYSNNGFVEYDSAGHLKQLGSFAGVPVSREQDIWKYLPSDYSKYATDLHGIKKLLQIIGTNAVDAAGTPIIVRTPWQYNPSYSSEFIEKFPGYSNGKSPIHIKPANRGKFTALKKRTGHSASWFKENGTPKQKKMAIFALNAKKWKH